LADSHHQHHQKTPPLLRATMPPLAKTPPLLRATMLPLATKLRMTLPPMLTIPRVAAVAMKLTIRWRKTRNRSPRQTVSAYEPIFRNIKRHLSLHCSTINEKGIHWVSIG